MTDSIEYVLMYKKQQVCLFKMPPLSTSKGYYLDDWKEMFWEGGVKLIEKNNQLTLQFVNQNDGSLVAIASLPANPYDAVQKTVDSQRGYAVRLNGPNGTFQWVGCVFRDRNDAFDLFDKLQTFLEQKDMEKNPNKYKNEFVPTKDFSLKEGQKIQIKIEGGGGVRKQVQAGQGGINAFKFEQPPEFGAGEPHAQNFPQPQQQSSAFGDFSDWSNFANFSAPQTTQVQPSQWQNQAPQPQQKMFNQPVQQPKPQQTQQGSINLLDL